MHNADLVLTLAGGLGAALVFGYITQRLKFSPIVGYLLAGIAVGPFTPGFAADQHVAEQFAHLGVALIMFGVGLSFHIEELVAVQRTATRGAGGQCLSATVLGCIVAAAAGWNFSAGVVFGLSLSVASTVVMLRVLSDNNALHTGSGRLSVGWLVVEDLITVLVLVLLPKIFSGDQPGPAALAGAIGLALLQVAALILLVVVGGGRVIPWLLTKVAATRSRELFTLAVLVAALGIAVGSEKYFHVSLALGAFLAGMVVGRTDFSSRAASEALPMRDAFAVLFFVSVGMLFRPTFVLESPGLLIATLAVVLVGKPVAACILLLLLGRQLRMALSVGLAIAQIGEFSFILAALGRDLKILPPHAVDALVAASIVSITVNPILYRLVDPIEALLLKSPPIARWLRAQAAAQLAPLDDEVTPDPLPTTAVVVGYGPVGRTLVQLLRENGVAPTVVELNLDTVQRLRSEGISAVYGDASHRDTVIEAGAERASAFILSSAGMKGCEEAIRHARDVNPDIRVVARAEYIREVPMLQKAGANTVFSGEGEVALAMTELVLRRLGATPEQIDRERERVRAEMCGGGK